MSVVIVIGIIILLLWLYHKFFKIPKLNDLVLVSGGVKTGKSSLSVYFAIKRYKSACRAFKFKQVLFSLFPKKRKALEKPLLYSNIPLSVPHVRITKDLILRKKRFSYGSVVFLDEASLLADSMNWKDDDLNDAVRLFCKLIAHETRGGCLIINTQTPSDLHFGFKRNISTYFYIHRKVNLPFFLVLYVREMLYSDEVGVQNVFTDDVEFGLRRVIMPKSVWKKFDCYTYSALTDDLAIENKNVDGAKLPNLKSKDYLHFEKKKKEDSKKCAKN